jgi:hypothetical protein
MIQWLSPSQDCEQIREGFQSLKRTGSKFGSKKINNLFFPGKGLIYLNLVKFTQNPPKFSSMGQTGFATKMTDPAFGKKIFFQKMATFTYITRRGGGRASIGRNRSE